MSEHCCEKGAVECDVDLLFQRVRDSGLRLTTQLRELLHILVHAERPLTLVEIEKRVDQTAGDRTTLFRSLNRLRDKGIVRRLGLHERAAHFALSVAGGCHDYLICLECGSVEAIDFACPLGGLEKEIEKKKGYSKLYHELELYGVCPECS